MVKKKTRRQFGVCADRLQALARLPVMARLAQRLPIRLIPKQSVVTAVRDDVVDYSGGRQPIRPQALRAERVFPKKKGARFPPAPIVAALCRRFTGVRLLMLRAIGLFTQIGAARMTAWTLWFPGHFDPPQML